MPIKKRQRSDSNAAHLEAFKNATADIMPPDHVHLRDGDLPFWRSIVRARAASTWTDADLETAANLARCKADIERLTKELAEQGDTLINKRGTEYMNPRHSLLETLSRRSVALSRVLHVHAEATTGRAADKKKALDLQNHATEVINDLDELIPTVN